MVRTAVTTPTEYKRRASYERAGSHETRRALVQSAVALWRTQGYAETSVVDICKAAGVSRALFYFHFDGKEDILFEVGMMSTLAAQKVIRAHLHGDYDLGAVIDAALQAMERSMSRNPRELIVEAILVGYRQQYRVSSGDEPIGATGMFDELFTSAQADGKLPATVDVGHLSFVAQTLVNEGTRHWAAGGYGDRSFSEVVSADVALLLAGAGASASSKGKK